MKVYIANPIGGSKQVMDLVKYVIRIAVIDSTIDIHMIDPFYYTPNIEGSREAKQVLAKSVLMANMNLIERCDLMIAIIDGRDIGVIWEMGYAHAIDIPIISVSGNDYGNNIMIDASVMAHIENIYKQEEVLTDLIITRATISNLS